MNTTHSLDDPIFFSRWREDDDLFDEDLSVEPLEAVPLTLRTKPDMWRDDNGGDAIMCKLTDNWESDDLQAPDDGPDVFEGEVANGDHDVIAITVLLEALPPEVEVTQPLRAQGSSWLQENLQDLLSLLLNMSGLLYVSRLRFWSWLAYLDQAREQLREKVAAGANLLAGKSTLAARLQKLG